MVSTKAHSIVARRETWGGHKITVLDSRETSVLREGEEYLTFALEHDSLECNALIKSTIYQDLITGVASFLWHAVDPHAQEYSMT